ncbi:hypothetical protein BD410DRAFT_840020 [Rickenella mellea]|uniref:Probable RNA polymerase II nuclear localization protein SLC7A6OS n=1 Tax=Rickenella mellea TaxID=50990 RepID=A0A4Y7Q3I8_9AGAM|nr:hypothetical protein BD410DRAFT_840020 [Rickenella mellea]
MGPSSSYTILRIKRKRTDEPLDALVVEQPKRRKSKGGVGVFQFAETVEEDAWQNEEQAVELKTRISTLAKEAPTSTHAGQTAPPGGESSRTSLSEPVASRRYTIVKNDIPKNELPPVSRYPQAPPVVLSSKDLASSKSDFTIYDAVLEPNDVSPPDPEMEKFQTLLQDYLKAQRRVVDDRQPEPRLPLASLPSTNLSPPTGIPPDDLSLDDYVWDVFYHRSVMPPEWSDVSKIATLTGLPPSLNDPNDSDSDFEAEDEDDEDSNAEDFYRNDYPEEEDHDSEEETDTSGKVANWIASSSHIPIPSDEFHEDSDDWSDDRQDRFNPQWQEES